MFRSKSFVSSKLEIHALRMLRMIAADTGERHYEVLTRLLATEAQRLRKTE